jgi:regulator of nonsense transcripts 2
MFRLSELLYIPLPHLPSASEQSSSILLLDGSSSRGNDAEEVTSAGKWEDEEERRFYEEFTDLKDFVPRSILGVESSQDESTTNARDGENEGAKRKQKEEQELKRLEVEMENVKLATSTDGADTADDECVLTYRCARSYIR